jgi:hypothetical protein
VGLAAIIAGILIYNHLAKPAVKIPEALIPQITHFSTYQKGVLVYVRVQYSDPGHYAEGFGFVGVNGSNWTEENHSFADPPMAYLALTGSTIHLIPGVEQAANPQAMCNSG